MSANLPANYDAKCDIQPVETSPLIPHSDTKRIRSYTNTFGFSSKRYLRTKVRLSNTVDKLHIRTTGTNVHSGKQNGSPREESASSYTTLVSPCSADCEDNLAWPSCEPNLLDSSHSSSSSSRHHESLLASVSLTLENSGSVARDHLASERTFLAYVRTSLAMASSGVALVQLFTVASANLRYSPEHRLHTYIRPLGAVTIVMGLIVLIIGVIRYFTVQAALTKGKFPVARAATGFITVILAILVTVTFGILVAGKLEPPKGNK